MSGIVFAAACLLSQGAAASDAPHARDSADAIVVTAERRPQPAAKVPRDIAVIGADEIARIGAEHPSEILNRAAGVYIHRGSGQEHLTSIRSPVLTGGAGAGSFLFLQDGVPLRAPGFANVNALFEAQTELADRIEIVRGPSGALYGANAIHGVIGVISPAPSERLSARLETSGDTEDRYRWLGEVSGTHGRHGLLAGVSVLSEAGFRASAGVHQQKAILRDDFTGEKISVQTIIAGTNLNQQTAGFLIGRDAYRDPAIRRTNANPDAFRKARSMRASSRIDITLSNALTLSTTPFARWTDMTLLMHFLPSQAIEDSGHWSIGAQSALYWNGGATRAIAGVDWAYTDGYLSEIQSLPSFGSFPQGVHYDYEIGSTSVSAFAKLDHDLTARLTASAAARIDWTRYVYDNHAADGVEGRFFRPADRTDGFVTISPKFSLLYALDRGSAYLSYARGARPPETSDLYRLQPTQTVGGVNPETIDSVELGWKGDVIDRVRIDAAAFWMLKRNFYFRDADGFNVPNGRTRHIGIEAQMTADLPLGFSLDMNAIYAAHTYRFDRPVGRASESIVFGNDVDTAPRWIAGGRLLWRPIARFDAEAEWTFVGGYFTDAANDETYPGHSLLHLRGEWRVRDGLSATVALRNVLNTFYAERADFAFGNARYFPGEGRTLSLGVKLRL